MKTTIKKKISIIMLTLMVLMGTFSFVSYADDSIDDDEKKIKDAMGGYADEDDQTMDIFGKLTDEDYDKINSDRDKIDYVLLRLLTPQYINNVNKGVLSSKISYDPRYNGSSVCDPNEPQNLLNHNCDIPNVMAEVAQNIVSIFDNSPITGGTTTSSYSPFGFGVPNGIPGGAVPVKPENRAYTYTALELYGYNLKNTGYNGEWDKINTSTSARVLSNFGFVDTVVLTGKSIFNGLSSGLGNMIENFDWNPITNVMNFFSGASGGSFNTIIDTSELNVVATHGWSRSAFNNTLYNVYVLSDKEVLMESNYRVAKIFTDELSKAADESPELQEVLALQVPPEFNYDPDRESEKSIEDRERAERFNVNETAMAENEEREPKLVEVPEPVMMTESEQFEEWKVDNAAMLARGQAKGLIGDLSEIETYDALTATWKSKWEPYAKTEFNSNGSVVTELKLNINQMLSVSIDPYLDPKQPISHYVCTTEDGKPIREDDGLYRYLYTGYNSGATEKVNPLCSAPRPSVRGALLGNGFGDSVSPDTRYLHYQNNNIGPIGVLFNTAKSASNAIATSVSTTVAKVTNEVLNMAFSPLTETLGFNEIAATMMATLRDTVFFPLVVLSIALGAVIIFYQLISKMAFKQTVIVVAQSLLIFLVTVMVLYKPAETIKFAEDVPDVIDNLIMTAVMGDTEAGNFCSVSSSTYKDQGIRSAQCNIWASTVFNPWVHKQFGTGYDDLYANGKAPEGKGSFENLNVDLVGDASVNMGGGHVINNWALYQLNQMKSGTITTKDPSNATGKTNPNLYRLVDLQAGPNNGASSDSKYFNDWADGSPKNDIGILSMMLSLTIAAATIPIAFIKIESSLMMLLYFIMIPVVAIRLFTQKGNQKISAYVVKMLGLIYRRIIAVMMLSIYLRVLSVITSSSAPYSLTAFGGMAISVMFIMYRKELLNKLGIASEAESEQAMKQLKDTVSNAIPKTIKNKYHTSAASFKGGMAGFTGGAAAGLSEVLRENSMEKRYKAAGVEYIPTKKSSGLERIKDTALEGYEKSSSSRERIAYRQTRKSGLGIGQIVSTSRDRVYEDNAQEILDAKDTVAYDVAREAISHTDRGNEYRTTKDQLNRFDSKLLSDPKVQKAIRRAADERRKELEKFKDDNDGKVEWDNDKIAKLFDERRKNVALKEVVNNPTQAKATIRDFYSKKDTSNNLKVKSKDIAVQLKETYEKKESDDDENDTKE